MSAINYQNVSVSVAGTTLYATSASFSFESPEEALRSLGQRNAIANIISGPTRGNLNIDYIVTSSSNPGKSIFDNIVQGNYTPVTVIIGSRSFPNSYLTSHSLSAESNSVVNASLSFDVFYDINFGGMVSSTPGTATISTVGHGSNSSVVGLAGAISFDYTANIEWEPVYVLQADTPVAVLFRGADERLNIRGPNLGSIVSRCLGENSVNVNIGALCGNSLFNIQMTNALIINSESSVEAGGFVEGSYELIKLY
jgi:hypothetical protein